MTIYLTPRRNDALRLAIRRMALPVVALAADAWVMVVLWRLM
jgi:hypothetical protein